MYKNQLQELAQRSCFNLPSYTCLREGPDHAPRFKAAVNFNGEIFESPQYCSTLRQAEHSAAEVALNSLSSRGPSHSLAARILDETGVYKNLLQEIAQRVGAPLPQYTTYRSGLGHLPVFTGTVELAGITFTGEPAKNKKQAEKNAAMAAWSSLKQLAKEAAGSSEPENNDELEQITIARALLHYRLKEKLAMANSPDGSLPFQKKFPTQIPRPTSPQPPPMTTSKILPLICPKTVPRNNRPSSSLANDNLVPTSQTPALETRGTGARPHKFPAPGAAPYVPIRQMRSNCRGMAPPVTMRTAVPVFSAPPRLPSPQSRLPTPMQASPVHIAPPVCIRPVVPVFAAPPAQKDLPPVQKEEARAVPCPAVLNQPINDVDKGIAAKENLQESEAAQILHQLKI
ncbi:double-stranded RNA-binding protein 2-like [Punica granatum]|uniref:Double-stranded RNA-binding protein 2-like n=1 Tax=Punica granatum TaxID=22663 RepID=A0A6P8D0R5_PUNGR|nr:double-stranded RNA-binding protein 2-like [Punica granatum]